MKYEVINHPKGIDISTESPPDVFAINSLLGESLTKKVNEFLSVEEKGADAIAKKDGLLSPTFIFTYCPIEILL